MGTDGVGKKRAVFLDRDGVINRNIWNPVTLAFESPLTADDFTLLPGVLPALSALARSGFLLFVVSNQPNYAKRKSSMEALDAIHQRMIDATTQAGIVFAACYYCFHHVDGTAPGYSGPCVCRKPSPHFLLRAQRDFCVHLARSWMIGDRESDVQCGRAAGTRTILLGERTCGVSPDVADYPAKDLCAATQLILADRFR
jgi:D-glycero-D-manno-heptose 1,7-bisphosphate phosphatase